MRTGIEGKKQHGVKKCKVLDLMCNNERISVNLTKLWYEAIGINFSLVYTEDVVRKSKEHGVSYKVKFIRGDIRRLAKILIDEKPFDTAF